MFTLFNLLSGCTAILLSFYDIALAGLMILLAGVFDFVDGLAARLLNAYSDFGKELDSLADMVSFGVAPSFILFHLIKMSLINKNPMFSLDLITGIEIAILAASFLPAVFASIRLSRFNVKGSKEDFFSGLPSPAAGIFIASAGYILLTTDEGWIQDVLLSTGMLLGITVLISVLMVLPVPMLALKFKNYRFSGNVLRYAFLIPAAIAFFMAGIKIIPAIIIYYIIVSLTGTRLSAL